MKNIFGILASLWLANSLIAQSEGLTDTLAEIEIFTSQKAAIQSQNTQTFLLEQNLAFLPSINLVNRSGYAPEISYRGLNAFQNQIKLDGMRVIGACTDKMDPVTSYDANGGSKSTISIKSFLRNVVSATLSTVRVSTGQFFFCTVRSLDIYSRLNRARSFLFF